MFTASHNPAQLQRDQALPVAGAGPVGQDTGLAEVRDLAQQLLDTGAAPPGRRAARAARSPSATCSATTPAFLRGLVDLSGSRPLKVVVDAGNGMGGHTVPGRPRRPARRPAARCRSTSYRCTSSSTARSPTTRPTRSSRRTCATCSGRSSSTAPTSAWPSTATPTAASWSTSAASRSAPAPSRRWSPPARSPARQAAGPDAGDVAVVHNVISSARRRRDHRRARRATGPHPGRPLLHQGRDGAPRARCSAASTRAHYYFRDFWFADTGMLAAMHVLAALGEQDEPAVRARRGVQPVRRLGRDQLHGHRRRCGHRRACAQWAPAQDVEFDELDGLTVTAASGDADVVVQPARVATPSRCCGSTSRPPTRTPWRGCATMCSHWSEEKADGRAARHGRDRRAIEPWLREILRCPQCQVRARRRDRSRRARAAVHQRRVRPGRTASTTASRSCWSTRPAPAGLTGGRADGAVPRRGPASTTRTRIAALDSRQTLRALATAGAQVREAIALSDEARHRRGWPAVSGRGRCSSPRSAGRAVVCDVLELLAEPGSPVPVIVRRNLPLPGWVGPLDLVIAVSLSGRAAGPVAAGRRGGPPRGARC